MPTLSADKIALSIARLTDAAPFRRELAHGALPPEGSDFDNVTVIYDVFRSCDGGAVVGLGPSPNNLEPWLRETFGGAFPDGLATRWFANDRHFKLEVDSYVPGITLNGGLVHPERLQVQPSLCEFFAGKRVLFTLSKDNPLEWIADWATFYADRHGCDAVLLYDNASTLYRIEQLEETLSRVPGISAVATLDWPFSYGVLNATNFCQRVMFEHARRRFLMHARSVVNADIDELAITRDGRSIFELAEQSSTGYVQSPARYVSNATAGRPERRRHRDFVYRERESETDHSLPKWAVVPARCPDSAVWRVHFIGGMTSDAAAADKIEFRHFRAISTNWRGPRWQDGVQVSPAVILDEELQRWLARVPWIEL